MPDQQLKPCCLTCHHWDMAQPGDTTEESGGWCRGRAPGEADEKGIARWPITFAFWLCGGHRIASNGDIRERATRREYESDDA